MIVTRLMGGLGNQLFQYAVGRHLAEIHGTVLKIDIRGLQENRPRWYNKFRLSPYYRSSLWYHDYSLCHFNIRENFATPEEVKKLTRRRFSYRLKNRLAGKKGVRAPSHITEKEPFIFDPDILNLPDNVYLADYWQNEKYFLAIENIIQEEFTLKTPQAGKDREIASRMASCESVSVHVRWGYKVTDKDGFHERCCDTDYYAKCVQVIGERLKEPHIFVFSDNPEWARKNLALEYPTTFVSHNGRDLAHEDLRLMSQCKHHIIANSTFSWWGAWLNPNKEKMVFAPSRWVTSNVYATTALIPAGWHLL